PHTSRWRAVRSKQSARPGLATHYLGEAVTHGDYAPPALRTRDGGGLGFFTALHFEEQTAAAGTSVPTPNKDVLALTTGDIGQSLTMEFLSNGAALTPASGAASDAVRILGRTQGLTSAKGE